MDKYYKQKFKVQVVKEGNYPHYPQKGDTVKVHYVGRLKKGGTKFDSSRDKNQPFSFVLGHRRVIVCWDMVVAEMTLGDRIWVTCPSDMAYGDQAAGENIPPNSDLAFEIEMLEFGDHKLSDPDNKEEIKKQNNSEKDDRDDL